MGLVAIPRLQALPHRRQRGSGRSERAYHHFIAPNASGSGDGTFASPWTLSQFLANPGTVLPGERTAMRCIPGSELYEQSGSYTWSSTLNGTAGTGPDDFTTKINLMPYEPDGGLPTISNSAADNSQTLRIDGTHVVLRDLRIRKNNTIRGNGRGTALWLRGAFDNQPTGSGMVLHCYIEDGANGIFTGNSASTDFQGGNWTIYGCYFLNNGEDDGPRNHAVYARHQGAGRMRFLKNIMGQGLANSLMIYEETVGVDAITNVDLEENICYLAGCLGTQTGNWWNMILGGGGAPADGPVRDCNVLGNILIHTNNDAEKASFQLGSQGATSEHCVVEDNRIYGGQQDDIMRIHTFRTDGNPTLEFRRNRFFPHSLAVTSERVLCILQSGTLSTWTWENNEYVLHPNSLGGSMYQHGGVNRTLAGLVSNAGIGGSDSEISFTESVRTYVIAANAYDPGRGHVVIDNPSGDAFVDVNLDAVLNTGDQFALYNAQDPHTAHMTGTYQEGTPVNVAMHLITPQAPIGTCPRTAPSLTPTFGVFYVVKTN